MVLPLKLPAKTRRRAKLNGKDHESGKAAAGEEEDETDSRNVKATGELIVLMIELNSLGENKFGENTLVLNTIAQNMTT
jgi:hypothetical protein